MTRKQIYVLVGLAVAILLLAVSCDSAHAGRCDGNQGNGKGNQCTPATQPTPPATGETDRQYIERVHTYAHGNSLGIQSLSRRTDATEAAIKNKVDVGDFKADQSRQDKALDSVGTRTGHLEARANQTDIDVKAVQEVNTQQNGTLANHGTRLDGHDAQLANMASVNAALDTRLNGAYQRLDEHSAQIARLERKMDKADEANSIALAVAGHQFDTKGGFQTAISASTMNGKQALAIGMGGALSERVFVNAGVAASGNTTGGVVSSTFSW